jgi:hypothetical protein
MENQIIEAQLQQLGLTNSYSNQNMVIPNVQQGVTRNTQGTNKNTLTSNKNTLTSISSYSNQIPVNPNQIPVNPNQNPMLNPLSEQTRHGDLEVLIATGKTKDFIGKQMSFIDLDNHFEKDILKYHRIYQSNMAIKMNDSFGKVAIGSYCHLAGLIIPVNDKEKLYEDLRNYYIVINELDRWIGWLSLRMGGLMIVASTSFMTLNNCDFSSSSITPNLNV